MEKTIEIPFGAFDSELKGWEYTIPEGYIARIEGNKIILELKESEDERIRKWIKKELESKYVVDNIVNNVMADKALAWLEKQGSQNLANSAQTCKDEPKFPSLSEKEIVCLKRILDFLREEHNSYTGKDFTNEIAVLEWLITHPVLIHSSELQPNQGEQNPAWSEEDEKTTQRIVDTIMKYAISPHSIINGDKPNLEYAKEFESWLKSLEFRIQPQWKPSDEQMEYLAKAITTLGNEGDNKTSAILCELRTDLKKLKG